MRLIDRLTRRAGYWEGIASGAAVLTTSTTYGSPNKEPVSPPMTAWALSVFGNNSVVFAAFLVRMELFTEVTFQFQALDDKHLFGNTTLGKLEHPFGPNSTTGDLLGRMEQDAFLVGNAYIWDAPGDAPLVRLRPDWTTIISEIVQVPGGGHYRQKIGYWVEPPKTVTDQGTGQFYAADEVVHWAPIPDPAADFRGISPLTPVYRDVVGDDGLTKYKIKYLDNSASPNLLIRYAQKLNPGTIDSVRERMRAKYAGVDNAFKTLVLDQGADVTVIGNSLQQMDFSNVSAVGVERILGACEVPGVLVGLEPLRGAGRGYQESMEKFANIWARPRWRSVCGALAQLVDIPEANRLWYDTSDIAALQDSETAKAQAALVRAQALLALSQAGYDKDSAVKYVNSGDVTQLKVAEVPPPPPAGVVQHMLPQTPPGVTADPLPPAMPRLPVGSTSPGDGGNGTRPTPRPTAGRRAIEAANGHS